MSQNGLVKLAGASASDGAFNSEASQLVSERQGRVVISQEPTFGCLIRTGSDVAQQGPCQPQLRASRQQ